MSELKFDKQGTVWVCLLEDNQRGVIQINQMSRGMVSVSANLPGMPPSVVAVFDNPYDKSVIFSLDIPAGVTVTLKSSTEVVSAVCL